MSRSVKKLQVAWTPDLGKFTMNFSSQDMDAYEPEYPVAKRACRGRRKIGDVVPRGATPTSFPGDAVFDQMKRINDEGFVGTVTITYTNDLQPNKSTVVFDTVVIDAITMAYIHKSSLPHQQDTFTNLSRSMLFEWKVEKQKRELARENQSLQSRETAQLAVLDAKYRPVNA